MPSGPAEMSCRFRAIRPTPARPALPDHVYAAKHRGSEPASYKSRATAHRSADRGPATLPCAPATRRERDNPLPHCERSPSAPPTCLRHRRQAPRPATARQPPHAATESLRVSPPGLGHGGSGLRLQAFAQRWRLRSFRLKICRRKKFRGHAPPRYSLNYRRAPNSTILSTFCLISNRLAVRAKGHGSRRRADNVGDCRRRCRCRSGERGWAGAQRGYRHGLTHRLGRQRDCGEGLNGHRFLNRSHRRT